MWVLFGFYLGLNWFLFLGFMLISICFFVGVYLDFIWGSSWVRFGILFGFDLGLIWVRCVFYFGFYVGFYVGFLFGSMLVLFGFPCWLYWLLRVLDLGSMWV